MQETGDVTTEERRRPSLVVFVFFVQGEGCTDSHTKLSIRRPARSKVPYSNDRASDHLLGFLLPNCFGNTDSVCVVHVDSSIVESGLRTSSVTGKFEKAVETVTCKRGVCGTSPIEYYFAGFLSSTGDRDRDREREKEKERENGGRRGCASDGGGERHQHARGGEGGGTGGAAAPRLPGALVLVAAPDRRPGRPRLPRHRTRPPRLRRHLRAVRRGLLHRLPHRRGSHRPPRRSRHFPGEII
ncbi:hypothetical protein B296_00025404 [Ensete ventricosum]|uniref:Uncharacterized protein n=1 Tax=Ensete ventricosum TaxID=4639 RepID=A0A426Z496_ENSVE|nr:hypothetical protein B296_00025404 [Ensete ventricosum]